MATLTRNDSMILNLTTVATLEENSQGACSSYQLMLEHAQNLQENIFWPAAQEWQVKDSIFQHVETCLNVYTLSTRQFRGSLQTPKQTRALKKREIK